MRRTATILICLVTAGCGSDSVTTATTKPIVLPIVIPPYGDTKDGTIFDNHTRISWLKNADCFGALPYDEAVAKVQTLASGHCGLTDGSKPGDWRLPGVDDFLERSRGFRSYGFTNIQDGYYWALTPSGIQYSQTTADAISLTVAGTYAMDRSKLNHVWPIKGGVQ